MSEDETRYRWRPGMREISGFGGGYEATCRRMLRAGLQWLDAHPGAAPQFRGFVGVVGVCIDDNDDAKALTAALVAAGPDCTSAMHQAVVQACLYVRANGWDAYVARMSDR